MSKALFQKKNWDDFYKLIGLKHKQNALVELIVKLGPGSKKKAKDLLGEYSIPSTLEFFEYIPYAVLNTTAQTAELLANQFIREGVLYSKKMDIIISDVDIAHEVHILGLESASAEELAAEYRKGYGLYNAPEALREEEDLPEGRLWNLKNVGRYNTEDRLRLGDLSRVAVLDTGCDYSHQEIRDRFNPHILGYNFIDNNSNPKDGHGHGTHVSGSVAGVNVGVAPYSRLYAVKVLSDSGSGSEAGVIKGIEWCIKNEMDVCNMSLGSSGASSAFQMICDEALKSGVIIVAAAGNEGFGNSYPAAFESVLSIAAVDRNKRHAEFSNKTTTLDAAGPGKDVLSCIPGGKYAKMSGTSMASPHGTGVISGGISLHRPKRNKNNTDEFRQLFKDSTDSCETTGSPMVDKWLYGNGHVNVEKFCDNIRREY